MITIEQNDDGTYTLEADGAKKVFATYEEAEQFVLDSWGGGEFKPEIEP